MLENKYNGFVNIQSTMKVYNILAKYSVNIIYKFKLKIISQYHFTESSKKYVVYEFNKKKFSKYILYRFFLLVLCNVFISLTYFRFLNIYLNGMRKQVDLVG